MAGNKINTKAKGKDEKGKGFKGMSNSNDDPEEKDFSVLRKPIQTNITGFAQARKIFDLATEELRSLLSYECDILYECKVCRNIFRSLVNFISHKRVYCKEKFSSSQHAHFTNHISTANDMVKIWNTEKSYKESLKEKAIVESMNIDEVDDRIPLTKDLTSVIDKITKTKGLYRSSIDEQHVTLQKIPNSSIAVFQNCNSSEESHHNTMRAQVNELEQIMSSNMAVLQKDGKFKVQSAEKGKGEGEGESNNVIQISDDEDNDDSPILKCGICDLQFSTQKTLRFHMKYKHMESRLVYPCPDCLEIFSTSWSVYRHLFKVHRKTAAQIRRLRESIQAKAFKMNNPPAFYERKKNTMKSTAAQKMTDEERLDQENQAWMDNMEGDGEVPRCGGCGRSFPRRAALAAHTTTCQSRCRALARRPPDKKIEIQIRKDYNKGPSTTISLPTKSPEDKICIDDESPIKSQIEEENTSDQTNKCEEATMEVIDSCKTEEDENLDRETDNITEQLETYTQKINLPLAHLAEKSNFLMFKQKIQPDVDMSKLLCKKCDSSFEEIQDFYDHVATHYNWMRYACKLCNYKHYDFEKLPEHVKVVHKLKGDPDFYFTTVKAIDGTTALALTEPADDANEGAETSPDSRRPSRCSSDSSRVSDDSSNSSKTEPGRRKRKLPPSKNTTKRKREFCINDSETVQKDDVLMNKVDSNIKQYEENSSDLDEIEERLAKRRVDDFSRSRRPIRKKTKPKNEDFEYDLSNLLKMEAQGYRESISVSNTKPVQVKKKPVPENNSVYEAMNKDCYGAMVMMSKKAVSNGTAHYMRTPMNDIYNTQKERNSTMFVRPSLPKTLSKIVSPRKEPEDSKEIQSQNKSSDNTINVKHISKLMNNDDLQNNKTEETTVKDSTQAIQDEQSSEKKEERKSLSTVTQDKPNLDVSAVVPVNFRRQSLEVIKNPLINKNITDFTKAGMKTKILVIKPINRKLNKDGATLKFQTIKLKDTNKSSILAEEGKPDQVVVVKVPKVDSTLARTVTDSNTARLKESVIEAKSEDVAEVLDITPKELITNDPKLKEENVSSTIEKFKEENDDKLIKIETDVDKSQPPVSL